MICASNCSPNRDDSDDIEGYKPVHKKKIVDTKKENTMHYDHYVPQVKCLFKQLVFHTGPHILFQTLKAEQPRC